MARAGAFLQMAAVLKLLSEQNEARARRSPARGRSRARARALLRGRSKEVTRLDGPRLCRRAFFGSAPLARSGRVRSWNAEAIDESRREVFGVESARLRIELQKPQEAQLAAGAREREVDSLAARFFAETVNGFQEWDFDIVDEVEMSRGSRRARFATFAMLIIGLIGIGSYTAYHKLIMPTPVALGAEAGVLPPVPVAAETEAAPESLALVPAFGARAQRDE